MSKSSNHYNGRNGSLPDMIVCHITEGAYDGAVSWLCNTESKASSHFVIGANGQISQLVDLKDAAWCNGNTTDPSSRLYYKNSLNGIVQSRATNANYYTYSIEHEGYSYKDRKGALTEAQYQASLSVMKQIITDMKNTYGVTFVPDRKYLIGHYEIDPTGKPSCPAPNKGENFPFDRFLTDIKAWMGNTDTASSSASSTTSSTTSSSSFSAYTVKVTDSALNIRSGPSVSYSITGVISDKGIYTIVDESNGWGKLKSGTGWISLDLTEKQGTTDSSTTSTSSIKVGSKVKVRSGAKSYTGQSVATFVYNNTYTVDQLSGDRAVLDMKGICTPFNASDLILV